MKRWATRAGAMILTLWIANIAWADDPPKKPDDKPPVNTDVAPAPTPEDEATPTVTPESPGQLSSWLTYTRPDCCGPIGGHGPIYTELYARTGPSIPYGGGVLSGLLQTGWMVQAGGRSLFFNPNMTAAWTADLGLSHTYNHSRSDLVPFIIIFDFPLPAGLQNTPGVTQPPSVQRNENVVVRDLNRTFVNLSLGREWYLNYPANVCAYRWRAGFDIGGRLGTEKANVKKIIDPADVPLPQLIDNFFPPTLANPVEKDGNRGHLTDTIYGAFGAIHSDIECGCCGCCTFLAGIRTEFGYTWSDILQDQNDADFAEINVLFNLCVRF